MAKKEILIFTRKITPELTNELEVHNYTIIQHLENAMGSYSYKYPRITVFVTADLRIIDIEELLWTEAFASLDECEKFFETLLDSYWRLASKNKFHCILAILDS